MLGSKRFWVLSVASLAVALLVVLAVGQFILHAIFDDQQIRTQVSKALENQGYLFLSDERIRKSWFPAPNITLYNVSLSDYKNTVFTAERVNVRFSANLLLGNKKVEKVTVGKSEWFIKKQKNGKWNIAPLFSINSNSQDMPNRLLWVNGILNIDDGNQTQRIEEIRLTGENMNHNGVIQCSGNWVNQNKTHSIPIQFHTSFKYTDKNLFLRDFSGSLKAPLPYFGETDIKWQLPHFRYSTQQNSIETGSLVVEGQSKNSVLSFNIRDTGWQYKSLDGTIESPKTNAIFHWNENDTEWKANLILEKSLFDQYNFYSNIKYNLTRKSKELIHTADATAQLKMDKNWQHIDLSHLNIQTVQSNINNTKLLWQTDLSGSADYAIKNGIAKAYLSGTLDKQPLQMIAQYNPKEQYAWQSKVSLNTLNLSPQIDIANNQLPDLKDVDKFLVEVSKSLKYLGNKKVQAEFSIERLKLGGGQINHVSATMEADKNNAQWKNLQAEIYGGTLKGSLKLNNAYPPTYTIHQDLSNIDVGNLLFDTIGYPYFSGIGNVYVDLKMKGGSNTLSNIEGDTVMIVENGLMRGLNIDDLLKNKANFSEHISHNTLGFNKNTVAPFVYFSMLTHWKNGIGETPTAIFESEMFNIDGTGYFDLNNQTMDYNFSLMGKLSAQSDPIYLPLHITGNIDSPQYTVDYNAVVRDAKNSEERQRAVQDLLKQQWNLFKQSTMN